MRRRWAGLGILPALCLMGVLGCDSLTVRSYAGSTLQMSVQMSGGSPLAANQHLEVWARNSFNDILRINAIYDTPNFKTAYGLIIRQAISLKDPCMIDALGNLLTSAAAYPTSVTLAGVTQTPDEQAEQVRERIQQLTALSDGGREDSSLQAVLPYDPTTPPIIPSDASAETRLAMCQAYWTASDLTYTPNPLQVTAPAHGALYGFLHYQTLQPPAGYDGFRLDTPINLRGIQELFLTVEADTVDPLNRGPLFLISKPTPGGNDVVHFQLSGSSASGTAALYVNLDDDPVQF